MMVFIKTIVLAKKLLRNEIKFEAVELLLLSPRREQKGASVAGEQFVGWK
jgi:hypothetical protein